MSGKNQFAFAFNWQSTDPATGFLPLNNNTVGKGSAPSGTLSGTMSGTNVIYSQILDVSRMDAAGIEITWTGTPTGTIEVDVSCSGINFYALTFSPTLTQPAGSAGGYYINLADMGFRYLLLKYTNASGTGVLTAYGQEKDWN